jgi:uncharacterized RDD family membrane protein YckC
MPEIQINPPLDPKKVPGWNPPGKSSPAPSPSPFSAAPELAGFFPRLAAVSIDLLALYLLASLANRLARPMLLDMGPGAPLLAAGVLTLYFAILTGPAGNGRTLGKHILKLRVSGRNGGALSPNASLIRAAIAAAPALTVIVLEMATSRIWLMGNDDLLLTIRLIWQGALALLVSNALCVLFDPLKRSYQDLLTGSIVVKAALRPEETPAAIEKALAAGRKWTGFQRAMLLAPFFLFIGLTVREERTTRKNIDTEFRNDIHERFENLFQITGTGHWFVPRFAFAADKPPQGNPDSQDSIQSFAFVMDFMAFRNPPDEIAQDLNRVADLMPELRSWSVDYLEAVMRKEEERGKPPAGESGDGSNPAPIAKRTFREGRIEVSFTNVLNLGYRFRGEPLAEFAEPFLETDLQRLGLFDDSPTSATLTIPDPAESGTETLPAE